MAILQISRIQIRRGLAENGPSNGLQLASGELGWTVDDRKLYIGNGTLAEGAPKVGNTEILTEYSNLLELEMMYTFKGERGGYTVTTGTAPAQPITRSWNDKFDDLANIRDFGGVGDGVADDVDAFNRAITQLYRESSITDPKVRRTLYVPAGTYLLSGDSIHMLPYVKLKGDGKNSTFIVQTDPATTDVPPVISSYDVTVTAGNSSSQVSGYFEIEDLTLTTTNPLGSVVALTDLKDIMFNRVRFEGSVGNVLQTSTVSCVRLNNSIDSSAFLFTNCDFLNTSYAFYAKDNLKNVNFINCTFTNLFCGISLGELFSDELQKQAQSVKITHSEFNNISTYGINGSSTSTGTTHIVSAFNMFRNVGYRQTNLTPFCSAIRFGGDNCYSMGDMFDKSYSLTVPAIQLNNKLSYAIMPDSTIQVGKQVSKSNTDIRLATGQLVSTYIATVGVELFPIILEYNILRGTNKRVGVMQITPIDTSITFADDYTETDDVGVELSPRINNGIVELFYSSAIQAKDAVLKISTRTLIGQLAPSETLLRVPGAPLITGVVLSPELRVPGAPTITGAF